MAELDFLLGSQLPASSSRSRRPQGGDRIELPRLARALRLRVAHRGHRGAPRVRLPFRRGRRALPRGRRERGPTGATTRASMDWLKRHTKFFVLLTLVFGAVTGVGIWFTIGLISPEATSNLIHIFVWAWAIEWVFFLVEILSILVYAYTWDTLPKAVSPARGLGLLHRGLPEPGGHRRHPLLPAHPGQVAPDALPVRRVLQPGLRCPRSWSGASSASCWEGSTPCSRCPGARTAPSRRSWPATPPTGCGCPPWGCPPPCGGCSTPCPAIHRILLRTNPIVQHFTWLLFVTSGLVVVLTFARGLASPQDPRANGSPSRS